MKITLLGSGDGEGWPNPFCTCASCAVSRTRGEVRGPTSILVDTNLLVDCGPDAARAAARLGLDLAGARHLLLSSGHRDDAGPAVLRWRSSAGRREPLDVVGPPSVVAAWREHVGADDRVVVRPVIPGKEVTLDRYRVRVLAAGHAATGAGPAEAVLYDVTSAGGGRLLYAAGTGPLPDATLAAVRDAAYDVVLLEETFGDAAAPDGEQHLDLVTFPSQLAELRRRGAVTGQTRVIAVRLGHHNPPPAELARRLAGWGAEVLADGSVLAVGAGADPPPPAATERARRVLVLGGARSGKSAEAERRLAADPAVTYVATARRRPDDPEWQQRVAAHRARRPPHWRTVETGEVERLLAAPPDGAPLLVDCLTLWLGHVLETAADPGSRVAALVDAWRATPGRVVAVSNEVGSGVVPVTADGRRFRDLLGTLNARLAAESDEVWLVTAGIARRLR